MLTPSSLDIIYSAMLCLTHGESAHKVVFLNVARSNISQCNMKYQIKTNKCFSTTLECLLLLLLFNNAWPLLSTSNYLPAFSC